jgi:hypothetical protein
MFGGGTKAAEMQVGVQRTEQDVGHVERAERALLEDGGELVAVARAPASGITAEEEGSHGTRASMSTG